jgi:hypothetical protein
MSVNDAATAAYNDLAYSQADLQQVMREHYAKIIDFVTSPSFKALMLEMSAMSHTERPGFVADVLLDDAELARRGVVVPEGILIQRSAFGDRRPTLFAVKHFLPEGFNDVWQNVNITFDNEYLDEAVPRSRDICWRPPLEPAHQALAMARNAPLEQQA